MLCHIMEMGFSNILIHVYFYFPEIVDNFYPSNQVITQRTVVDFTSLGIPPAMIFDVVVSKLYVSIFYMVKVTFSCLPRGT